MPVTGLPTSDYSQQALQDAQSSNPQTALLGDIAAGQATNIAGTNLTVDSLMAQLGLVQPQIGMEQQYGQLQGQQALAQAGLGEEQLGLQAQGLGAQAGLLNTQYGIQQQTLAGQEQLAGTQYGLSQQEIAAQKAQQAQSYGNQVENTAGGLAAQGAGNTQGAKQADRHERLPEHPGPASHPKAADRRTGPVRLPTATVRPRAAGRSRSTAVLIGQHRSRGSGPRTLSPGQQPRGSAADQSDQLRPPAGRIAGAAVR